MPLTILSVTPSTPAPGQTVLVKGTCDDCSALSASAFKGATAVPVTLVDCTDGVWTYSFVAPPCEPDPPKVVFEVDEGGTPIPKTIPLDCE